MLRLTLILCAATFAALVILADRAVTPIAAAPNPATEAVVPDPDAALREVDGDMVLTTAHGEVLQISAMITPSQGGTETQSTIGTAGAVMTASGADRELESIALPVVEVSGSRVNLRSGPSTETDILDALVQGTRAEVMASLDDGWAQIRVIESGIEGYMADRFLTAVN